MFYKHYFIYFHLFHFISSCKKHAATPIWKMGTPSLREGKRTLPRSGASEVTGSEAQLVWLQSPTLTTHGFSPWFLCSGAVQSLASSKRVSLKHQARSLRSQCRYDKTRVSPLRGPSSVPKNQCKDLETRVQRTGSRYWRYHLLTVRLLLHSVNSLGLC